MGGVVLDSAWPNYPAEQFGRLRDSFSDASRRTQVVAHEAQVAGHRVVLRVAGQDLAAALFRPLLRAGGTELASTLTIELWDSTAAPDVFVPTPRADLNTYGFVTADSQGRFVTDHRPNGLLLLDRAENRIVGHYAGAKSLFLDERARPLHRLLSIWLGDRDVQFIHAGMVSGGEGTGVLLAGGGGAGKSTTSLLCLLAGYGFLSDDFVAFSHRGRATPVAHCLFTSAVVQVHHLQRFPSLVAAAHKPNHAHEDKSIVFVEELLPGRVRASVPIRAILLPQVMRRSETRITPASSREALLKLAPSSVMLLPGGGPRALERLAGLVKAVPAFRLELGFDYERIPDLIARQVGAMTDAK